MDKYGYTFSEEEIIEQEKKTSDMPDIKNLNEDRKQKNKRSKSRNEKTQGQE